MDPYSKYQNLNQSNEDMPYSYNKSYNNNNKRVYINDADMDEIGYGKLYDGSKNRTQKRASAQKNKENSITAGMNMN